MKKIENFKVEELPVKEILFSVTSLPDYEMDRIMVVENQPDYNQFLVVHGWHCSCYDFGDSTDSSWEAIQYSKEELITLIPTWIKDGLYTESRIAKLLKEYFDEREY